MLDKIQLYDIIISSNTLGNCRICQLYTSMIPNSYRVLFLTSPFTACSCRSTIINGNLSTTITRNTCPTIFAAIYSKATTTFNSITTSQATSIFYLRSFNICPLHFYDIWDSVSQKGYTNWDSWSSSKILQLRQRFWCQFMG